MKEVYRKFYENINLVEFIKKTTNVKKIVKINDDNYYIYLKKKLTFEKTRTLKVFYDHKNQSWRFYELKKNKKTNTWEKIYESDIFGFAMFYTYEANAAIEDGIKDPREREIEREKYYLSEINKTLKKHPELLEKTTFKKFYNLQAFFDDIGVIRAGKNLWHVPWREDKHASLSVFKTDSGQWKWKDFAKGETDDVFEAVRKLLKTNKLNVNIKIEETTLNLIMFLLLDAVLAKLKLRKIELEKQIEQINKAKRNIVKSNNINRIYQSNQTQQKTNNSNDFSSFIISENLKHLAKIKEYAKDERKIPEFVVENLINIGLLAAFVCKKLTKEYIAIGLKNRSAGYNLKIINPDDSFKSDKILSKGASQNISYFTIDPITQKIYKHQLANKIYITEGMFDAMSVPDIFKNDTKYTVISMNSINNITKLKTFLGEHKNLIDEVYICLDNDPAGKEAAKELKYICEAFNFKVNNVSHIYSDYKDLNEFLKEIKKSQTQQSQTNQQNQKSLSRDFKNELSI